MPPINLVLRYMLGAIEALLLGRLVLKLLAARPDNSAFAALFALTGPLRAPFAALDAGQPRFGSTLELSTLALCMVLAVCISVLSWAAQKPNAL